MLWPLVIIALDIIMCVIFCKRCRRYDENADKLTKDKEGGDAIETKPLTMVTVAEEGETKETAEACEKEGKEEKGKGKGKSTSKTKEQEAGEEQEMDPQTKAKLLALFM